MFLLDRHWQHLADICCRTRFEFYMIPGFYILMSVATFFFCTCTVIPLCTKGLYEVNLLKSKPHRTSVPAFTCLLAHGCLFEVATRPGCKLGRDKRRARGSGVWFSTCSTVKPASSCGASHLLTESGKKWKSCTVISASCFFYLCCMAPTYSTG